MMLDLFVLICQRHNSNDGIQSICSRRRPIEAYGGASSFLQIRRDIIDNYKPSSMGINIE